MTVSHIKNCAWKTFDDIILFLGFQFFHSTLYFTLTVLSVFFVSFMCWFGVTNQRVIGTATFC